ncbi:drug resistance transporter, Bcr/CflA subfamily [Catenulispora acidiphila DSM 44928]|uniref:Drug resistance transporter, Bcr/CflA subfamily n=2 Tax=Catenulispora TaxID=414878 RepID=C7QIS3_CATAD|nr:multidrug effflux MFS transporter [Catenulispora acidiphila]ACU76973.1 drug resistance transporter, Bcr/CflA subfamily [Catenulispora acidiphila DSM 44928]
MVTRQNRAPAKLLLILGALSMFGPLSLDMYLPALPDLAHSFRTPEANVQLTLTACMIGLAVGQLVAGPMSDAWGRKKPLAIGLIAYAATSLFCAVAPDVYSLTAARLLQGLAGAAGLVISRAMVRDLYEGDALTKFFSTLMLVNGLAPILAPVIGGQLTRFMSWRGVFIVLAAIGVALLAATVLGLKETLPAASRGTSGGGLPATLRTFRVLMRDRGFMGYILTGGFAFAAMFAYISGSPFVLENIHGLSKQQFSLVFGTNALGIMIAGQAGGRLVGRVAPARLLGAGLVMSFGGSTILLIATAGFGGSLPGTLLGLFLMVSSIGVIMPQVTALALSGYEPAVAGAASAMIGTGQFLFGAIFAPLTGLGSKTSGMPMAMVIFGLSAAAVVMRALLVRTPRIESEPIVEPAVA